MKFLVFFFRFIYISEIIELNISLFSSIFKILINKLIPWILYENIYSILYHLHYSSEFSWDLVISIIILSSIHVYFLQIYFSDQLFEYIYKSIYSEYLHNHSLTFPVKTQIYHLLIFLYQYQYYFRIMIYSANINNLFIIIFLLFNISQIWWIYFLSQSMILWKFKLYNDISIILMIFLRFFSFNNKSHLILMIKIFINRRFSCLLISNIFKLIIFFSNFISIILSHSILFFKSIFIFSQFKYISINHFWILIISYIFYYILTFSYLYISSKNDSLSFFILS